MKKVITAIFDKCTGYMDPVVTLTQEEAIRGFRFALMDKDSPIGFSPADFDLYQLGFYDRFSSKSFRLILYSSPSNPSLTSQILK